MISKITLERKYFVTDVTHGTRDIWPMEKALVVIEAGVRRKPSPTLETQEFELAGVRLNHVLFQDISTGQFSLTDFTGISIIRANSVTPLVSLKVLS